MTRLRLAKTEADFIAEKVQSFESDNWDSRYVAQFKALPLNLGWGGTIGIRMDGVLVWWSTEGEFEGCRDVDDVVEVRGSLVLGAQRYPELKSLIPPRPEGAHTCAHCAGSGFFTFAEISSILCGGCGGVGWVDASPRPAQVNAADDQADKPAQPQNG